MMLSFVAAAPLARTQRRVERKRLVSCSASPSLRQSASVAVVGAGLVGVSIALELANRRKDDLHITIVSRDTNEAASNVAAGMLAPTAEVLAHADGMPEPLAQLGKLSRDMYPDFLETALPNLHRTDPSARSLGYRTTHGFLLPVVRGEKTDSDSPTRASWLTAEEANFMEPALDATTIEGAWYVVDDAQIDARLLYARLIDEAKSHPNISFLANTQVESLRVTSASSEGQSTLSHVILQEVGASGTPKQLPVDHAVLTTGAWTKELMPSLPVTPVRGQIVSLSTADRPISAPPILSAVIYSRDLYIVPKPASQRILIGATMDREAQYAAGTALAGGVANLLSKAIELVPELAELPVVEMTSGLRPAVLPDRMPLIGTSPAFSNVTVAAGHYRNGVLLLPVSTKLATAHVMGGGEVQKTLMELDLPISICSKLDPGRFTTRKGNEGKKVAAKRDTPASRVEAPVQRNPVNGSTQSPSWLLSREAELAPEVQVWHVDKNGNEVPVEPGIAPECFTRSYGDVEEDSAAEPAQVTNDAPGSFVPEQNRLPDAYDDVLIHRNDHDPEEAGRKARAKNRSFGVNSTKHPGSSLTDEEWEAMEAAEAAGAADAEELRQYIMNPSDPARLSTLAEERHMEGLDEEGKRNYVSNGYF